MRLRQFIAKLRQAQHYNPFVVKALLVRLQTSSRFARVTNVSLWVLFHLARIARNQKLRLRAALQGRVMVAGRLPAASATPWLEVLTDASRRSMGKRVLIVAELALLQCKKYRVEQKVEQLETLGFSATVLPWNDFLACRNALQTHGMVIFYRTPAFPDVKRLVDEAHRLGLVSFFDIDDLVFDVEEYARNGNVKKLPADEQKVLMDGAALYLSMLQLTDHAIASTLTIAERMAPLCRGRVLLLENALDNHLLGLAETCRPISRQSDVLIAYGSGTKTHDADFLAAARALVRVLERYAQVRLVVFGFLKLPEDFSRFSERVIRVPFLEPDDYYRSLAEVSINLAPLENTVFNDAKSNIKFLEAALFGIPTVASPAAAFKQVIRHGANGFIAGNEDEWFAALVALIDDAELRQKIGSTAQQEVLATYRPDVLAERQMKPILELGLPTLVPKKTKILLVNLLFSPLSFGGATIVAEQLAVNLNRRADTEVTIFTGCWHPELHAYDLARYEWQGVPVLVVRFPDSGDRRLDYDNPEMTARFAEVLQTVQPDIVHFHSIQVLGASLADACQAQHIPYAITLHDAWWLCERQFMVRADGRYCAQAGVDMTVCASCVPDPAFAYRRHYRLREIMENAALLLTPSHFQKQLYVNSGLPASLLEVNGNGILPPVKKRSHQKSTHLTFAYLGGRAVHKGYFWLREIFADIGEGNYTLRLVDIESKLSISQMAGDSWNVAGKVEIVPPFEPHNIDDFFADIDVLLFPSQWKESFGLTVREALARDVWVIATDSGGPIEDIVSGVNGDIFPMHDAGAYAERIRSLLQNPEQLHGYRNHLSEQIRYFPQQADELAALLQQAVAAQKETVA